MSFTETSASEMEGQDNGRQVRAQLHQMIDRIADQTFLAAVQDMIGEYHSRSAHHFEQWERLQQIEEEK